jgi:serine/threonine protein kinase
LLLFTRYLGISLRPHSQLDDHLRVKVCDFGLSAVKNPGDTIQDKGRIAGSPIWLAPEVMLGQPLDERCDIYRQASLQSTISRMKKYIHMDIFSVLRADRAQLRHHPMGDCHAKGAI